MDEHKKWLDESRHKQEIRPKTETPVVFTHEVTQKHQVRYGEIQRDSIQRFVRLLLFTEHVVLSLSNF